MKVTSLQAWIEGCVSGSFKHRSAVIYKWLLNNGDYTRFEIAQNMRIPINIVCGRVNDLLKAGFIEETDQILQPTGKYAYKLKAKTIKDLD